MRQKLYTQIQQITVRDAVYLWICQPVDIKVYRSVVQGEGVLRNPLFGEFYYYPLSKKRDRQGKLR